MLDAVVGTLHDVPTTRIDPQPCVPVGVCQGPPAAVPTAAAADPHHHLAQLPLQIAEAVT